MKFSNKRTLNDRLWDKLMPVLDKVDSALMPVIGCFATIGLCTCIVTGVGLIIHNIEDNKLNVEGQEVTISAQITEVADDGVMSHVRKYHCAKIEKADDSYIKIKDVKDDFGHTYETVVLQNIPYIIERTIKTK